MNLKITTEPSPILHRVASAVAIIDLNTDSMKQFVTDLTAIMYSADGVGIAAPQVGHSIRMCVIAANYSPLGDKRDLVLVNPIWTKLSLLKKFDEEGCLSVPNIYGQVKRYTKIKVRALDSAGHPIEFVAKDFCARVIQHEVDHLDGVLFIEKAKNLRKIVKE